MKPPGLIVALDDPDLTRSEALAKSLSGRVSAFKVGLTLFSAHGPESILEIGQHGKVFYDCKLHDIPQQVKGATSVLARLGVWMLNVHASGGRAMIEAAVRSAAEVDPVCIVAAVTVLTSLSTADVSAVGQGGDPAGQALRLAGIALDAGARALICSPHEIAALRAEFGEEVLLVVPGIRPANLFSDDQARVATPAAAAAAGADYLVVGRPITSHADPAAAVEEILAEIAA